MLKICWKWLKYSKMADHTELIAELPNVEKMTTQERLKHAKKRRLQQLKQHSQREKEHSSKRQRALQNLRAKQHNYKVHFDPSVMLLEAAARNDVDEVRRLLLLGVNPDSTNEDGLTALHQCCIDDSEKMMRLLLEFGANVNAEDSEKWTPLHAAATCGHLNLAKYLINKGANLLAVNADGNMPYDICEDDKTLDYIEAEMARRGVTQQLIDDTRLGIELLMLRDLRFHHEQDGDLDQTDEQSATYLHIASANGYISVVEFLLENGANPNLADNDSWQPVHAAACWGHPDILEKLAYYGADLEARTKNGETPYDICEDPELKERIQQLKTEMDKRQLQQPPLRLRRTQSNTRSVSVRRTSIRDKNVIKWKEAREEAKMRMDQQEILSNNSGQQKSGDDEANNKDHGDGVSVEDITVIVPVSNCQNGTEGARTLQATAKDTVPTVEVEKAVDGHDGVLLEEECKDNNDRRKGSSLKRKNHVTTAKQDFFASTYNNENNRGDSTNLKNFVNSTGNGVVSVLPPPPDVTNATSVSSAQSQSDLKLDVSIHVTVNTGSSQTYSASGMGTLTELKKQRTASRNRASSVISTTSQEQLTPDGHKVNGGLKSDTINSKYPFQLPPPSPSVGRQKYYSPPTEVVGPVEKQGCCVVM